MMNRVVLDMLGLPLAKQSITSMNYQIWLNLPIWSGDKQLREE
jgi:hypothetical protein